ncbi:unnamed protein product [Blepharisma stoltei]|uniref:Casein kinase I n=1 Tax=Blepharisma stoltei TaxID=1481888 RepID=A0AAU9K3Q9_9CILI|nr:unnamed protein product [Blepharisma stoltei]
MDNAIGCRFIKESTIGEGNFGSVYRVIDTTNKKRVALKIEKPNLEVSQIENEIKVISAMKGHRGFPRLIDSGTENGSMYIAMQLLGSSLEDKFQESKQNFGLMAILNIAEQILMRIQALHDKFFIHRDIKPRQFLFSPTPGSSTIYMIDFGLSKCYQNGKTGVHIQYMESRPFIGTANYASINTHIGIQQSRRDDLESYMYMISYFLNGTLPWISKDHTVSEREIRLAKNRVSVNELFHNGPAEFVLMMAYIKSISFEDKPDYEYLEGLIKRMKSNTAVEKRGVSWFEFNSDDKNPKTLKRKIRKAITDPFNEQPNLFKALDQCTEIANRNNTATLNLEKEEEEQEGNDGEELNDEPMSACITEEKESYPEIKDRNILKNREEFRKSKSLDSELPMEAQKCCVM